MKMSIRLFLRKTMGEGIRHLAGDNLRIVGANIARILEGEISRRAKDLGGQQLVIIGKDSAGFDLFPWREQFPQYTRCKGLFAEAYAIAKPL